MKNSLRSYRKKAKFTLKDLAAKAGVGTSTIGHVETGHLIPSDDFWEKVSAVLGVSKEFLQTPPLPESGKPKATTYGFSRPITENESHMTREELPESNWERRARTAEAKLDALEAAMESLLKQFRKQ